MKSSIRQKLLAFFLLTSLLVEPILARRSGGGHSRGSSAGRSGGFGGSRSRGGTSHSNTGGGYHHNTGGTYNRGNHGVGSHSNTGSGGMFGANRQQQHNRQGGYNTGGGSNTGGGFFKSSSSNNPKFNKGSGLGSMVRSNTFKNAIVGAAAGYLTYQAGKHLIRSAMAPMYWGNRQYYWGSNYYQPRPNYQMCRMPVDASDSQFGNIYFQDHTRPKEIVWSCSYNEHCCGYECCPGGGGYGNYGGGYGNPGYGGGFWGHNSAYRSFGFGSLLVLILISCCACFLVYRVCNRNRNTYQAANPPTYNAY